MNPCIAFLRRVLLKTDALLCDLFDPLVQGEGWSLNEKCQTAVL